MNVEKSSIKNLDEHRIIWSKLKKGDNEALGQLYDIYIDQLLAYGISISNDKSFVMDCIHDLFVDLYKYRAKLADTNNVKYYLLTSLKRKIFKTSKKSELFVGINNSLGDDVIFKDHTESFEDKIIFSEIVKEKSLRLIRALNLLTKKQKAGLLLRFDQERSYTEIAQILDISVASARTTVYRAIKLLRESSLIFFVLVKNIFF